MSIIEMRPVSTNTNSWNKVFEVMNAYALSEALYTATDLDVFGILERRGPLLLEEIAEAAKIKIHAARVLLLGICATQLVTRDPDTKRYRNSEAASELLVDGAKNNLRSYVQFSAKIQRVGMLRLTDSVREGRNEGLELFPGAGATLYERLRGTGAEQDLYKDALGAYSEYLLDECLQVEELYDVRKFLDVGGGSGTTAIRLCKAIPGLDVTVLDAPSVCEKGREKAAACGLSDRIKFCEGDAFEDAWPTGHDGIFMGHFPEIFAPDRVCRLYQSAFDTLEPGGMLFLWVAVTDDNETGGRQAAKTSMYFLSTASVGGITYPIADHVELLQDVGFAVKNVYRIDELEHACIVARRNQISEEP
jgi:hypothetical protein